MPVCWVGALDNTGLAAQLGQSLGTDLTLGYHTPQLAGGAHASPAGYARFLRKLLNGQLQMSALLGSHAVCTNPATCATALYTPIPATESWHYALGHWVEDDPAQGDGSFSSPGAFGFYPWIDASRTYYGIIARQTAAGQNSAFESVLCGRLVRKAWLTGVSSF
jgi:CubicO group peptidase (beta-lactamase class C family)